MHGVLSCHCSFIPSAADPLRLTAGAAPACMHSSLPLLGVFPFFWFFSPPQPERMHLVSHAQSCLTGCLPTGSLASIVAAGSTAQVTETGICHITGLCIQNAPMHGEPECAQPCRQVCGQAARVQRPGVCQASLQAALGHSCPAGGSLRSFLHHQPAPPRPCSGSAFQVLHSVCLLMPFLCPSASAIFVSCVWLHCQAGATGRCSSGLLCHLFSAWMLEASSITSLAPPNHAQVDYHVMEVRIVEAMAASSLRVLRCHIMHR